MTLTPRLLRSMAAGAALAASLACGCGNGEEKDPKLVTPEGGAPKFQVKRPGVGQGGAPKAPAERKQLAPN
jgi:hypothetical protein